MEPWTNLASRIHFKMEAIRTTFHEDKYVDDVDPIVSLMVEKITFLEEQFITS